MLTSASTLPSLLLWVCEVFLFVFTQGCINLSIVKVGLCNTLLLAHTLRNVQRLVQPDLIWDKFTAVWCKDKIRLEKKKKMNEWSLKMNFANTVPAIRSRSGEASSENKTLTSSVCLCPFGRLFFFFFFAHISECVPGGQGVQ